MASRIVSIRPAAAVALSLLCGTVARGTTTAPALWRVTDAAAIQPAVDACAAGGGGRVDVAAGDYPVGPIQLRSHVDLHLDRGATLRFTRDFAAYPLTWVDDGRGPEPACRSPIWGDGLTDVAITGEGVIDGQGDAWRPVKKGKLAPAEWDRLVRAGGVVNARGTEWFPAVVVRDGASDLSRLTHARPPAPLAAYAPFRPLLRPHMVRLSNCTGVRLAGVTFRNSAMWNVHLSLCDHIDVCGVTISNVGWAQNGDGIDLDSCRDVTVADSTVNAGDDAICLKSGQDEAGRRRGRPTENVTITRCTVGTGHGGVVIGSEMSGGVRHVRVSHCTFVGTDNGLRFKSTRGRGGVVEDVVVDDVRMSHIRDVAILFDLYYAAKAASRTDGVPPVTDATPAFRDFHIGHVTCDGAGQSLLIRGLPEMPLRDVTLDNVTVTARTAGVIADAVGVTCHGVVIQSDDGSRVRIVNAPGLHLTDSAGFAP